MWKLARYCALFVLCGIATLLSQFEHGIKEMGYIEMMKIEHYYAQYAPYEGKVDHDKKIKLTRSREEFTDPEEERRFMRKMELLHLDRRRVMNETCCQYGHCLKNATKPHPHNFFSHTYKYTVCWIQKCSYSSWLRATLVSDGVYSPSDRNVTGDHAIALGRRHTLTWLDIHTRREVWNNYTKLILVRQPFERLVSAFNAKLNPVGGQSDFYARVSRMISDRYRIKRENETERKMPGDGFATFEDFANYLLDLGGNPMKRDSHWREYESLCQPCRYNYDVIMKFDTFADDFRYIKRFLNVSEYHLPAFFPIHKSRTNSHLTETYMTSLSPPLRKLLYRMFEHDFEMFGYPKPHYV